MSYPRASRSNKQGVFDDDREYIYQHIEKIQGEITSTKEFEETFSKTLELLERKANA